MCQYTSLIAQVPGSSDILYVPFPIKLLAPSSVTDAIKVRVPRYHGICIIVWFGDVGPTGKVALFLYVMLFDIIQQRR